MINLMFAGNYKVFDGLTLALLSATKHTKEPLNIYILTADVTELNEEYRPISRQQIDVLTKIVKEKNSNSSVRLITLGNSFTSWIKTSQNRLSEYTPFAFLRLFADDIAGLPDKIIYLDCDVMINSNLKELFDVDISDYELGVVLDRYGKIFIKHNYFNSGMLLMNLKKIRQTGLFKNVRQMCATKKMNFPDQTALNKLCKFRLYLPRKFNEQGNLRADTVVQHFSKRFTLVPYFHTVNIKPWDIERVHNERKNFAYDDIYNKYSKIKENGDWEEQKEL